MSKQNHHYRDNDFNAEQTAGYTLLVHIGQALFSYAVIGESKLLVLEENIDNAELTSPTGGHDILFSNFKQRIIGLAQKGFTFIPASLYSSERLADFARFLDVKSTEKVLSQSLDAENQVIFKAEGSLVAAIADKFDINNAVFSAKGWIKSVAAAHPTDHTLYLNIDNDLVEILNFKDGKLRFYNSFEFKTEDELAYFASFVAGELQLQPEDVALILSGDISADDQNFKRLTAFFGKVELSDLKVLEVPVEIAAHTVLTLTALSLCGSSEAL